MFHLCWRASPLLWKSFQRWEHPSEIKLQTNFGCVSWFLEQESGVLHVVCPSVTEMIKAINVCASRCQMCPSLLHPKQSCAPKGRTVGAVGSEQDQEYNTLLEGGFTWKECLFLWDRNQNTIFLLGCLGWVLSQEGLGHQCVGHCLVSTQFKARNLVLNERRIRDHHSLLESKQHWRSDRARPG